MERTPCPYDAYSQSEYGVKGLFVGVPVILGINGIEEVIIKLTPEEKKALANSVNAVKGTAAEVDKVK